MQNYLYLAALLLLTACGQTKTDQQEALDPDASTKENNDTSAIAPALSDKTVKFLWRDKVYDEELKDTFHSIVLNEAFCKTITGPEKAALGYVATFIGNECRWDGECTDDRSNLKCKILTGLDLGYQCSEEHLGFLRKWFKNDKKVLEELEYNGCPTTPDGATIQSTFDEITLTVKGNRILVSFKASGINLREQDSWSWSETDYFQVEGDNIRLIKKDVSKVKREKVEIGE